MRGKDKMGTARSVPIGMLLAMVLTVGTTGLTAAKTSAGREADAAVPQDQAGLVIENDTVLPDTYPDAHYMVQFTAHGAAATVHWKVEKSELPPGLKLEDNGQLHGQPQRTGEFQFTLSARDDAGSQPIAKKSFVLHVHSALMLDWKNMARVNGNRIEGSAQVTNTTADDVDLTFVVMAVAGNGRATAIGYQHFSLPKGTPKMELPFGDTLPRGGYVVHVDVVGEVAPKKLIYRERMQTGLLTVAVGP